MHPLLIDRLDRLKTEERRWKGERRMLRKALWTGLYAGTGAAATMAARRTASGIWRRLTGEEPPTKK
jgi:hypothetical protein